MARMTPDQRADARAFDRRVKSFIAAIRDCWPEVDVEITFERLCLLGGCSVPPTFDLQAKKAVLGELVNNLAVHHLNRAIARHARHAIARRKKKEAKLARKAAPPRNSRLGGERP